METLAYMNTKNYRPYPILKKIKKEIVQENIYSIWSYSGMLEANEYYFIFLNIYIPFF